MIEGRPNGTIQDRVDILNYWIEERENIRKLHDAGAAKPWTNDPILGTYRFCNVHREDDKVTRWIKYNWRDPYYSHPNMVVAMALARLINWPEALGEIGFPADHWMKHRERFLEVMDYRLQHREKSWTGAYMITAEHLPGVPKHYSVVKTLDFINQMDLVEDTCHYMWDRLQDAPRVGSFIAAQIVADLKHTAVLFNAVDKTTFCAPGPGSQRGLNWLIGISKDKQWDQKDFEDEVNELRHKLCLPMDAQDAQNCLCELAKYVRGYSRSKYV